jgi:3-methylcrotonyl-CoA carboxylase beta subunit
VRDRIDRLLDPGSPFLELSPLAAYVMYGLDGSDDPWTVPAAGIVTGIGLVSGRAVAVVANDATVKGGSYYPMTVKKHLRSEDCRAEPAAVHRPGRQRPREPAYAGRVFPDRFHFGRIFSTGLTSLPRECRRSLP